MNILLYEMFAQRRMVTLLEVSLGQATWEPVWRYTREWRARAALPGRIGMSIERTPGPARTVARNTYHDRVRFDVIPHVPHTGGTLLDVGGGTGATARWLQELGRVERIGVIDVVDAHAYGDTLDFACIGNLEDQLFVDECFHLHGPFNCILCLDVLEHLIDPWDFVRRAADALLPNGVMVASIPNVRNYRVLAPLLFRNQWTLADAGILDRTHLRFFVKSTAVDLLASAGLTIEAVHASPSGGRKVQFARKVTLGLLNSFTDRQYIVCARK